MYLISILIFGDWQTEVRGHRRSSYGCIHNIYNSKMVSHICSSEFCSSGSQSQKTVYTILFLQNLIRKKEAIFNLLNAIDKGYFIQKAVNIKENDMICYDNLLL